MAWQRHLTAAQMVVQTEAQVRHRRWMDVACWRAALAPSRCSVLDQTSWTCATLVTPTQIMTASSRATTSGVETGHSMSAVCAMAMGSAVRRCSSLLTYQASLPTFKRVMAPINQSWTASWLPSQHSPPLRSSTSQSNRLLWHLAELLSKSCLNFKCPLMSQMPDGDECKTCRSTWLRVSLARCRESTRRMSVLAPRLRSPSTATEWLGAAQ